MASFVVFDLEILLIRRRQREVIERIFSRAKRSANVIVARSDKYFHVWVVDERAAQALEKIRKIGRAVVG